MTDQREGGQRLPSPSSRPSPRVADKMYHGPVHVKPWPPIRSPEQPDVTVVVIVQPKV